MSNNAPVAIQPDVEATATSNNSGCWRQVLKWLHGFIPLRLYYEPPYGRASLEAGLRSRSRFPSSDWEEKGIAVEDAVQVLRIVQKEMNLPNFFLIPDDPLSIVMTPDYDDFPQESVRCGIRKALGIDIGRDTLRKAYEDNWTISDLVKLIISAAARQVSTADRP